MEGSQTPSPQLSKPGPSSTGFDLTREDGFLDDYQACLDNDTDLYDEYLEKLRQQRERMEKLEKCYQEKQQQLCKEQLRSGELTAEIEKLMAFVPYKEKYDYLKQDYTELLSKYNIQQKELQLVKQDLDETLAETSGSITKLKAEIKTWKDSSVSNANQLEQALNDKESEFRKLRKDWKDREEQYLQQAKGLKNAIAKLKAELENETKFHVQEKEKLVYEIKNRDLTVMDYEKALEQARRTNIELKNDFTKFDQEVSSRQQQLVGLCTKLKAHIAQQKKTIFDRESRIDELDSELKKTQASVAEHKQQIAQLKVEFRRTCDLYESGNKKIKYESDSQIGRLEAFIKQLKQSIEELVEGKSQLEAENRKLMMVLRKKEHSEKQRKELLRFEFKEIDRIEKVIDRLQ